MIGSLSGSAASTDSGERIARRAREVLRALLEDKSLAKYVDGRYDVPLAYQGDGPIRLIVLGQDPTVKNAADRAKIRTVLNLDKRHSVWAYLQKVCLGLGLDLKLNVYATNLFKNFFVQPPTQITQIDTFAAFLPAWLPLLVEELTPFKNVPVITLGEPLLRSLLSPDGARNLKDYWGYTPDWRAGMFGPLGYLGPEGNLLGRTIYPFPHQPSVRKPFYHVRMDAYTAYVRGQAFSPEDDHGIARSVG